MPVEMWDGYARFMPRREDGVDSKALAVMGEFNGLTTSQEDFWLGATRSLAFRFFEHLFEL